MWNSKMAARWTGNDGKLNAGNSDFPPGSTPSQLVLSRRDDEGGEVGTQSCMDHSILAIFEDPAATSEDKSGAEEENQTLLSALTKMLDSVGDDEGTLSPFDTLPDTKLLVNPELRDDSVELSLAERLRPRTKAPNLTLTIKIDGKKENESKTEGKSPSQLYKEQSQTLFHPKNKKTDAEVEVFTSTSLANLVKIMHSYCLRLHVEEEEEGDKLRKNHMLFSQEEVWKYERPTEESDEEINVVSDDEIAGKDTKEEEKRDRGQRLKSVLLNGNSSRPPPPREKKRVSFGPVQVSSYEESVEKSLNEKNLSGGHTAESVSAPPNSTKALELPAGSALETQTPSSEMSGNKAEVVPPRGETKAKALSLQQYRQLRRKRQPLVEKQGNYTTKWPSVSEPPKELTPILCLQALQQNSCGPKTAHQFPGGKTNGADPPHRSASGPGFKTHHTPAPLQPHPPEAKPPTPPRHGGLKRPRTESKIVSPASRFPEVTADADVGPESKKSPVKKPALVSSDPPNPVLLPLPASQISSSPTDSTSSNSKVEFLRTDSNLVSTKHFQHKSSGTSPLQLPSSFASGVSESPTTQIQSSCNSTEPQIPTCCRNPTQDGNLEPTSPVSPSPDPQREIKCPSSSPLSSQPPTPLKETSLEDHSSLSSPEEPSPPLQFVCGEQSATADSGIEAPDLTSLLEQFEETQAKEERVEPNFTTATSPSNLPTDGQLDRAQPVGTERPFTVPSMPPVQPLKPLSTSESPGSPKTLRNLPHLQVLEAVKVPEPLGTEIILSTQPDLPAKRKNPPSKAIQIIDPRPLPSRKTHSNFPESHAALTSPHIYLSISSDHDYCSPVDHSSSSQSCRAPKFKDISKTTDESQATARDSNPPAESKKQTSAGEVKTIGADSESAKSLMQQLPEEPRARPEPNPSTDAVLSDAAATERDRGRAAEDQRELCVLPAPPVRGRNKRRYRRRSPRSDSSSSSCSSSSSSSSSASRSPKRQKRRHRRSESSSCSSSPSRSVSRSPPRRYRWSYSRSRCSRSRSRSWSQSRSPSRSRSPSPRFCRRQWRDVYRSRESRRLRREHEMRIQKLKAIDERRVVYVGRICRSMTHDELRERFAQFGEVECVSLHFREKGDHYGFVTFYNMDDAFAAIDNGGKLRRPDELPFDLCFGGRRQFCNSDYADLDANRDADPCPAKSRIGDLDFDSLLKQAQKGLKR